MNDKLQWTLLLITSLVTLQVEAKICCITLSSEDEPEDCGTNIIPWHNITRNMITSCTKLQFSPKNYTLTENLLITAVNNFSINGNGATFQCNYSSSLIIDNSNRVQIMNANFNNCGELVNIYTKPSDLFPSFTKAAIILYNSFFITIKNTMFKDSCGYAIIGVNMAEESYFENISVIHGHVSPDYSKQQSLIGGFIFVYPKTNVTNNNTNVKVFIKHCNISNITNSDKIKDNNKNSEFPLYHLSCAIGLIFHQQLYYIEIQIHQLMITNITSVSGPLLLVSTHFTTMCTLNIILNRSIVSYNKNNLYPIIHCLLNATYPSSIQSTFSVTHSRFHNDDATHIFKMDNTANDSATVVLDGNNIYKNSVTASLFCVSGVIPIFRNHTYFASNRANIIFSFSKYIELDEWATVRVFRNKYNQIQKSFNRFVFEKTNQTSKDCPFQVYHAFSFLMFCNNIGYYRELHGNYLENNCNWTKGSRLPANLKYRKTIFNCDEDDGYFKWENNLFVCDSASTVAPMYFEHPPIYPGQSLTLKLIHSRDKVLLYTDFPDSNSVFTDIVPTCQLDPSKHTTDLVYKNCTNLSYTIKSHSMNDSLCLLKLRTATPKSTLYAFKVNITKCPIGFSLDTYYGICKCDPKLEQKLKGIECRILDESFRPPPLSWISKRNGEIIYTSFCNFDYCLISHKFISLSSTDDQCLPSRRGIACGQCNEGLSTVFGTSQCKKCSNFGLFIVPVLAMAGLLLVMMLFVLNLTVVNGNIHGFIVFVNILSICALNIFATKKEVAYVLILLSNLDLGIEMCFYDGMTTYVATWLQFLFPVYLLLIVVGLVIASRYISKVEKITRKKVIPVIATLYLLSYNKIMTVTFRGLFSYNRINYLNSGDTKLYWSLDTEISVPSTEFVFLFLVCGVILLILIIPTNILLLFTKKCYCFKFVVTYLKPFIDAYQAPFKDDCRYLMGLELLLRAILHIVNCVHTKNTAAIYSTVAMLYVAYLCWRKPFKNKHNLFFYVLYILLLGGISIIFMNYAVLNTGTKGTYEVILNLLVYLAFIETLLIFVYHLWKQFFQHYKFFIAIETCIKAQRSKYLKFKNHKKKRKSHIQLQGLTVYDKYQEELLALSPNI